MTDLETEVQMETEVQGTEDQSRPGTEATNKQTITDEHFNQSFFKQE